MKVGDDGQELMHPRELFNCILEGEDRMRPVMLF